MVDVIAEPQTEIIVGEPLMKDSMRSLVDKVEIPAHLEDWEKVDYFREKVEIPLTKFETWVSAIAPDITPQSRLTDQQLGRVIVSSTNNGRSVQATHEATQMEAVGKDESEARAQLANLLDDQLQRWQAEGNLETQAQKLRTDLIQEYRQKLQPPW